MIQDSHSYYGSQIIIIITIIIIIIKFYFKQLGAHT